MSSNPNPKQDDDSPETRPLGGRHAWITGGGHGIGAAIAAELAGMGANITISGRNEDALAATAERVSAEAGVACRWQHLDIADPEASGAALSEGRAALGPVTVLVNNAGIAPSRPISKLDLATWNSALSVNVTAPMLLAQAVLPDMLADGFGRIVNIASTAGLRGYPFVSAYVASKHALIGLTRALALELAKGPVTVNAVCPGYTETAMAEQAMRNIMQGGKSADEARAILARPNPQGRLVDPSEVAQAVGWICQPGSTAITGQAIAVAGGEVM